MSTRQQERQASETPEDREAMLQQMSTRGGPLKLQRTGRPGFSVTEKGTSRVIILRAH